MKKYITYLFTILLMFSCTKSKLSNDVSQMIIKTSAVCEMCVEKIESKVNALNGVKSAKLHLPSKSLSVQFDNKKVKYEEICTAINEIGYDANEFKADEKLVNSLPACCKRN